MKQAMCYRKVLFLCIYLSAVRDVSSRKVRSLRGGDDPQSPANDWKSSARTTIQHNGEPLVSLFQENMSIDAQADALIVQEIAELRRRNVNLHRAVAQSRLAAGSQRSKVGPIVAEFYVIYALGALLLLVTLLYCVRECTVRTDLSRGRRRVADRGPSDETELARDVISGYAPGVRTGARRIGLDAAPPSGSQARALQASNRARREAEQAAFEQNRREIAIAMLMRARPVFVLLVCLFLAVWVCNITVTVIGLIVFFRDKDLPCDQPLQWWLVTALAVQYLQAVLDPVINERPWLQRLNAVVTPLIIFAGIFMYSGCKSCADTNPHLYRFVKMFIIAQILRWAFLFFTTFFLVGLIFAMALRGLLDDGQALAAGPNLIKELETVEFDRDSFLDDTGEPRVCSVCQEDFDSSKPIKRTPCGHDFHEECLGDWLGNYSRTCPLCRLDLEEAVHGTEDMKEDGGDHVSTQ